MLLPFFSFWDFGACFRFWRRLREQSLLMVHEKLAAETFVM